MFLGFCGVFILYICARLVVCVLLCFYFFQRRGFVGFFGCVCFCEFFWRVCLLVFLVNLLVYCIFV